MASHSLSFLRPMALPRPATISHFLRRYATEASTSTLPKLSLHPAFEASSKPAYKPSSKASPPSRGRPSAPKGAPKPKPFKPLVFTQATTPKPYTIQLTPSSQYPVYTMKKRGGNMKLTKIRKIDGDLAALKNDLIMALRVEEKEVSINQLTRHVIVKGHKKPEIEMFLKSCEVVHV